MNKRQVLVDPQPKPVPGKKEVKGLLRYYADIPAEVRLDCIYKMEASEKKYGSPLMTENGRNACLDAYTDLIDTINYTVQMHQEETDEEEKTDLLVTIDRLSRLAVRYRHRLEQQGVLER